MKDGVVRLTIDRDSKNEFDKGMYISGFMSASRTGMHHYDPKKKALHSIKTEATQINQKCVPRCKQEVVCIVPGG